MENNQTSTLAPKENKVNNELETALSGTFGAKKTQQALKALGLPTSGDCTARHSEYNAQCEKKAGHNGQHQGWPGSW